MQILSSSRIAIHGPLPWPSMPRPSMPLSLDAWGSWQYEVIGIQQAIIAHYQTTQLGFQLHVDPAYWLRAQEWCWHPGVPESRLGDNPVAMLETLAQGEWALQWRPKSEENRHVQPPRDMEFQHPVFRSRVVCCTTFPAPICSCGRYLLAWGIDDYTSKSRGRGY